MNYFILFLFLLSTQSFAANAPLPQTYRCLEGNNDSVCDQKLRMKKIENTVTMITIEYVGDCGSQGPYPYYCTEEGVCSDGVIQVSFINEESYHWKNLGYNIHCRMGR